MFSAILPHLHICVPTTTIHRTVPLPQYKECIISLKSHSPFSPSLNPWQIRSQFSEIVLHRHNFFFILRPSCKWNHTMCNHVRLTFITQHNSLEIIQVVACVKSSFLSIAKLWSTTWRYPSLFNHSLHIGHLGCLILATTSKTAINTHMHACVEA